MEAANSSGLNSTVPPKKNVFRKVALISTISIIVGLTAFYFICGMTYSDGTRSGILTKVSRKGYVFKTYEGEINIGGINQGDGTIMPATVFKFSIKKKDIYDKVESMQGKKIIVRYKEVIKVFFWQGESKYFVYDAKLMN
jgi:hypothetical protein